MTQESLQAENTTVIQTHAMGSREPICVSDLIDWLEKNQCLDLTEEEWSALLFKWQCEGLNKEGKEWLRALETSPKDVSSKVDGSRAISVISILVSPVLGLMSLTAFKGDALGPALFTFIATGFFLCMGVVHWTDALKTKGEWKKLNQYLGRVGGVEGLNQKIEKALSVQSTLELMDKIKACQEVGQDMGWVEEERRKEVFLTQELYEKVHQCWLKSVKGHATSTQATDHFFKALKGLEPDQSGATKGSVWVPSEHQIRTAHRS